MKFKTTSRLRKAQIRVVSHLQLMLASTVDYFENYESAICAISLGIRT